MRKLLTRKLFIPASDLRRRMNPEMKPVYDVYRRSLIFRREAVNWTEYKKRAWVLKALRSIVRKAANETTYYKTLFKEIGFDPNTEFDFDDFAAIPKLGREEIQIAGDSLISNAIPLTKLQKDATGGSTGTPTEFWLGTEERGWKESGLEHTFDRAGIPRESRMAFFWGHHLDPQATDGFRQRLRSYFTNTRWFDCFRLSPEVFLKYHQEFELWSPDCIVAYASALGQFAEFLKENNIQPKNYPKTCFVTGAEKLFPEQRKIIEEVFGKPVYERYGGRDFGLLGIQEEPRKNLEYKIDWAWALVEPESCDENASILVTKLHADGMPMLRYRVGDIGQFPQGSKPGHPAFSLLKVVGRDLDRIWLRDETYVNANQFPHMLKDFPIREFMLIQEEDFSVELQLVVKSSFDDKDENAIKSILAANLGDLSVTIKQVESIPRTKANKWRPVITKVKR